MLSGNVVVDGMSPRADRYGGHQFGNWAGQLGDGRAIALGEVVDADGTNQTLQLKGAGPTPYSRTADGRAVFLDAARSHSRAVRALFADALSDTQLEALADAMDTLRHHLER